jgi:glycerol uptake facilitator-like aquaporin
MDSRTLPVLRRSTHVTLRAWWRAMLQLFHEAIGAIFAVFAFYGGVAAWREWKTHSIRWLIAFAIGYAVMMAAFSFVAFRRARRVQ